MILRLLRGRSSRVAREGEFLTPLLRNAPRAGVSGANTPHVAFVRA